MSAVINQAKLLYHKLLIIEVCVLLSLFFSILLWKGNIAVSFLVGGFSAFLPHCIFVYWIFFRKRAKNTNKMAVFYRGEGLKWLSTVALIILTFKLINDLNMVVFFAGYFFMLLCNSLLPVFYKLRAK